MLTSQFLMAREGPSLKKNNLINKNEFHKKKNVCVYP